MVRFILIKVCYFIFRAWLLRRDGTKRLKLPEVPSGLSYDEKEIEDTVSRVDSILSLILRSTRHICYYRSYVLAVILREKGLPVVLNVGGRALWSPVRMKAHCWLTLDEERVYEKDNSFDLYPLEMGYNSDRSIRYWIGEDFDEGVLEDEAVRRGHSVRV
ncbi:MAG: lasso peptide biosynthesis protein [Thermodesulfovibrionales bacterium]|nr:lasso peptide biosynthesis protein [Thermodesulfovibrionales bacterium]